MPTLKDARPLSVDEYLEGENLSDARHEFVGGVVFAMMDVSQSHNLIAGAFQVALHGHLRDTACRVFGGTMKLRIGNDFYYSDVLVVCDPTDVEPRYVTRPSLIVDVLSPCEGALDVPERLPAYQGIGSLLEYVMVEPDRREIHVYRRIGATWRCSAYAGASSVVDLASVGLSLPLDEIYSNVA
jgi:Uma2 family endonuclease